VRRADKESWLNIKRAVPGVKRAEYDYPIPINDARQLLSLCIGCLIEKTRHSVVFEGRLWEVDVFEGENAGLTVAEIELDAAEQAFERPPWLGEEISHDLRYYNNMLATHPFKSWS
jgi:adenylate cyclase